MFVAVGEEDEVSIKEAAEMVVEAMGFTGPVVVSLTWAVCGQCSPPWTVSSQCSPHWAVSSQWSPPWAVSSTP